VKDPTSKSRGGGGHAMPPPHAEPCERSGYREVLRANLAGRDETDGPGVHVTPNQKCQKHGREEEPENCRLCHLILG